jgi:hypothetical protein
MSPEDYERVVADIVKGISDSAPALTGFRLGVGRANRLLGASTYEHQIDVSLLNREKIYLVECKRWEAKIGVEEIMILAARCADIAQRNEQCSVQAIIASTKGLTRGGRKLAQFFNIQVEVVRSAQEFGFRIGDQVRAGMADGFGFTDRAVATVIHGGSCIDS